MSRPAVGPRIWKEVWFVYLFWGVCPKLLNQPSVQSAWM